MLHDRQLEALYSFVNEEDFFVNLPTGYGKSLIFQMAPLVHVWMNENISPIWWKKDPIILIVSPLLALMQDQVKKLTSLGLKAAYVGAEQEPAVLQDVEEGKFMFVFVSPKEISESPNKVNVRYCVQKLANSLPVIENFRCLIHELIHKGKGSTRTIIYCQTVKQCSHLFRMFELELGASLYDGERSPKNTMHSGSPASVKNHVLDQFGGNSKSLRILIATIAYGMGVNCKGVTRVIHFGPSKSIEAYMQESGRCGRNGEQSDALLLYNGINVKAADSDMKNYINATTCRRKLLMKHFGVKTSRSESPTGHMCCDICAESCRCQGKNCDMDLHLPTVEDDIEQSREISKQQTSELEQRLDDLRKTIVKDSIALKEQNQASIFGCPTKLLEFGTDQVQQVIDNAKHIFSISNVLKYVDIWQKKHAVSILKIFRSIFNDVEEPMSDSDSEEDYLEQSNDEWVDLINDQSFMDLMDQSEWFVDSMLEDEPLDNADESAYPEFLDNVIGGVNMQ